MKLSFPERRKVIEAERNFEPGLAQDEEKVLISVMILGALAIIGCVTIVYFLGIAIINLF